MIKILFLFLFIICFYILLRLVKKRQFLLQQKQKEEIPVVETFYSISGAKNKSLPLNQYVIKSSFNTALNNSQQIDLGMVVNVLKKGCRFIDFEIYSVENIPTLGYSSSRNFSSIETGQKITFDDLCKKISTSAFSSPIPNSTDPLFIHLRIKSKNLSILDKMAASIEDNLGPRVHRQKLNADTLLSSLDNKIIFVVDISYIPDYTKNSTFTKFISLESSNSNQLSSTEDSILLTSKKKPLILTPDGKSIKDQKWLMVIPGFGINISDKNSNQFLNIIKWYGGNIVPFKFYQDDDGLQEYENFFQYNGSTAFVPLTVAQQYLQNMDTKIEDDLA